MASARADGQQHLAAKGVFDLSEIERGFALVTQHFKHSGTALFRDINAVAIELDDVHL